MATVPTGQAESGFDILEKGLKPGALGLLSSTVIALASVAPAYSLAATIGFVVISVGLQAPVIMVLAFVPMYCVAVGYRKLNEAEPDAGTTFTWATRTFGPRTGWMGGWAIVAADVIVMANLAAIAGSYFFLLFNADGRRRVGLLADGRRGVLDRPDDRRSVTSASRSRHASSTPCSPSR